jgi:transposase-like protein
LVTTTRKQYSPNFKARVAIEAIRGEKTLSQLGSQYKVHPIQIAKWRKAAMDQLPELFVDGRTKEGCGCRDRKRRPLWRDRQAEGRAGLAQKKVGMLD